MFEPRKVVKEEPKKAVEPEVPEAVPTTQQPPVNAEGFNVA